jgi:predicted SprT family Zn-dependent metalloprotease
MWVVANEVSLLFVQQEKRKASLMRKNKKPPRRLYFCCRCGLGVPKYRYTVAVKAIRERCLSCGGNLVMRRELPVGVNPIG